MNDGLRLKREIGRRIQSVRREMNLTKENLARKIGITPQYLGIIEKGESALSYEKLKKLCDITETSADYILFGKDVKIEKKTEQLLEEFSYDEIQNACEVIKQIAVFIKKDKKHQ